jgi:hypothetical protein
MSSPFLMISTTPFIPSSASNSSETRNFEILRIVDKTAYGGRVETYHDCSLLVDSEGRSVGGSASDSFGRRVVLL